jgi:hypothetical protein
MWASAFADYYTAIIIFFVKFDMFDQNMIYKSFLVALMLASQHFVIEGIAFLLMQYGCGSQGTRYAAYRAGGWGLLTFVVYLSVLRRGNKIGTGIVHLIWQIALIAFYSTIWLTPDRKLFRREAAIFYAKFWTLFRGMSFLSVIILIFPSSRNIGTCFVFFGPLVVFSVCKTHIIYRALLADSIWWMGAQQQENNNASSMPWPRLSTMSSPAISMKSNDTGRATLQGPLVGLEVGFNEAQELAQEVCRALVVYKSLDVYVINVHLSSGG